MKNKKEILIISVLVIIIIASSGVGYFYYNKYQTILKNANTKTTTEADEVTETINRVSALIDLPKDETPTVATVLEKEKLQDQPFFRNCENGDKVLVYSKSKKAILYRPSSNKIIESTTVTLN